MAKKRGPAPKPMPKSKPVSFNHSCHIVDTTCDAEFSRKVAAYIEKGYVVSSSHVCIINDASYQYCSSYQAIMVKKEFHA